MTKEKGPAFVSENQTVSIKDFARCFDTDGFTPDLHYVQAAIVARRFRLTPVRARLVCNLAGIGGRYA